MRETNLDSEVVYRLLLLFGLACHPKTGSEAEEHEAEEHKAAQQIAITRENGKMKPCALCLFKLNLLDKKKERRKSSNFVFYEKVIILCPPV